MNAFWPASPSSDSNPHMDSTALYREAPTHRLDDASTLNEKSNINISAYRVLFILKILVQHSAIGFQELNDILMQAPLIGRGFNGETITKYMNTLRHLGCAIPKASIQHDYQYKLTKAPLPVAVEPHVIKVLNKLLMGLMLEPDERFYLDYKALLNKVAWSIADDEKIQQLFEVQVTEDWEQVLQKRKVLSYYRQLCRDGQAIEVVYQYPDGQPVKLTIEPKRVSQSGHQFFLRALDRNTQQQIRLNLDSIVKIRQLRFKVTQSHQSISVIFQLTGRLAKNYRLYPNESFRLQQPEKVLVKAVIQDPDILINRLLKYGNHCEIISPGFIRQEMHQRLSLMLQVLSGQPGQTPILKQGEVCELPRLNPDRRELF